MLSREEYSEYCTRFNIVYNYFLNNSESRSKTVMEISSLRGYEDMEMNSMLYSAGFLKLKEGVDVNKLSSKEYNCLGLFKEGRFILEGRYIFPVKDMLGNVIALIGWYPDEKKYITSSSGLFSKKCLFYGMEQLGKTGLGKNYFLVEGIFDALALRSLGSNALAMMGIDSSKVKTVLYGLFKRIIAIPDIDSQGRGVVTNDTWSLPSHCSYMNWNPKMGWKDIDEMYKSVDLESLKDLLSDIWSVKERVITLS